MPGLLQSALVGTTDGQIRLRDDSPVPGVSGNTVLIKVKTVSINPVDSKMEGAYVTAGAVAGCDVAGVVEQVGPEVHGVKVGDRVSTSVMGMNPLKPTVGAFAEYTTAHDRLLLKLPPSTSFEEGAALPTSFLTAGLALFQNLGLPGHPFEPNKTPIRVLVYGGSSATGTAAIQLLKLAGFEVLTTCSPHNFDLVRGYGADTVFDYKAPDCAAEIKKHTRNGLKYVLDCISNLSSMQFCYQAMGRSGGKYTALEPYPASIAKTRTVIKADWILALQVLGHEIAWPEPHGRPADDAITDFGTAWTATLNELLAKGLIRSHPLIVREGGLGRILEGIQDVRSKKISGKKLVYTL
ncbi:zinc-binding alcohol dehydrogenase family protein [Aspergillus homomorphus CBS 101889]|uniref:NAD(P)-binding protein n=1 Tax=Aspergillus homomorphus (strain CBS 101889) TaxID=1450537 RepID=A0A395HYZ8_ASPHC|nr:NAD(P)-binding protein [Aspergillus homomorphus CBS 101889]RAL11484.1 NAD(P)-binding protein [Aspergillus homomorphus CBS 101889]